MYCIRNGELKHITEVSELDRNLCCPACNRAVAIRHKDDSRYFMHVDDKGCGAGFTTGIYMVAMNYLVENNIVLLPEVKVSFKPVCDVEYSVAPITRMHPTRVELKYNKKGYPCGIMLEYKGSKLYLHFFVYKLLSNQTLIACKEKGISALEIAIPTDSEMIYDKEFIGKTIATPYSGKWWSYNKKAERARVEYLNSELLRRKIFYSDY